MSLKEDLKKVIGPHKDDIDYMEWRKQQSPANLEHVNAHIRAIKEYQRSPENQEKYNNIFYPEGAAKRKAGGGFKGFTEEDLRAREEWNKFVEAWRKENGRPGGSQTR